MSTDLARLGEVLRGELAAGCADELVAGGLDTLLRRQARDEAPGSPLLRMVAALPAEGYRTLDADARRGWLRRALATIEREQGEREQQERKQSERAATARRNGGEPSAATRPRRTPQASAPAGPRAAPAPAAIPEGAAALALPIARAGVGVRPQTLSRLERLGLVTIGDALRYFPYRHHDFSRTVPIAQLRVGLEQTVRGRLDRVREVRMGRGGRMRSTEATVSDASGASIRVIWFNQPYMARQLREGAEVALAGTVRAYRGRPSLDNPEFEFLDAAGGAEGGRHTGRLVPVYHLTAGLAQRTLRTLIAALLERYADRLPERLPPALLERHALPPLAEATRQLHYPDDAQALESARRRLAFDELLAIQLGVVRRRRSWQGAGAAPAVAEHAAARAFVASLPFELTGAQRRVLTEVLADVERPVPMSRLLEGDVGSGKTVVALAAMLDVVASGRQAVLMAPTEVLAEQHLRTIRRLLSGSPEPPLGGVVPLPFLPLPLRVLSLTGSTRARERREVLAALAHDAAPQIVVGTHALIQEGVALPRLGLAVVDEQHRFGVMQRSALRDRARPLPDEGSAEASANEQEAPAVHLLVMTATPIPRSLALTVYGDLDLSVIDEMPPGRTPIETRWLPPERRDAAFERLRAELDAGRQAFVICPLVEGSEAVVSRAATEEYERIRREELPDRADRVALLHGRLPAREKEAAMARFTAGEAQVLVSTAVVEVGIDVPNATVMLIEGADRFGMAQLHQFRGRVGRGEHASWCFLLADDPTEEAAQRLAVVERTHDGFALAQADLELRGPGELYGLRQSGASSLHVAALLDAQLIDATRREAAELLDADPELEAPEHAGLRALAARAEQAAAGASEVH